jgi:hypothetical protein
MWLVLLFPAGFFSYLGLTICSAGHLPRLRAMMALAAARVISYCYSRSLLALWGRVEERRAVTRRSDRQPREIERSMLRSGGPIRVRTAK